MPCNDNDGGGGCNERRRRGRISCGDGADDVTGGGGDGTGGSHGSTNSGHGEITVVMVRDGGDGNS